MTGVKENCGVAAVHIKKGSEHEGKAPYFLYRLLLNMQNRGQLSAGITTYNHERANLLDTYRSLGTVNEAFKSSIPQKQDGIFTKYAGNMGIGHTRYATCGEDGKSYAQPFERKHGRKWKWFSFCFNGNIANYSELKDVLMNKVEYHITYDTDSEIIMHYIARELYSTKIKPNYREIFRNISKKFDGAYNIAFIDALGSLVVVRDPLGIKPMCYAQKDDMTLIASESAALSNLGFYDIKFLQPGEMIIIKNDKLEIIRYAEKQEPKRCMFEWVYFSNVSSVFDERSVYKARTNLGKELAKMETEKINKKDYIVIPVPDSSKPAGEAYAFGLGLPTVEGLVRNRFVGRTFIESTERMARVRRKFSVLREVVEGKKVLLVDDSVVRGTTSKSIVKFLKEEGGAKEVHLRVSCPPIVSPCFYGIDMSSVSELFASKYKKEMKNSHIPKKVLKKMADEIGADSLIYQTVEGLVRSISYPENELCVSCLTGKYITPWGKKLYTKSLADAGNGNYEKRTYE
ncbi:amidophosphoribosyltransferase [Candidatus Woesearchaeota archaeon]|nr:amidophosphoribosyltransferase [Candidatus Woesearchaeota archaeon]